jgi:hypothetical protein
MMRMRISFLAAALLAGVATIGVAPAFANVAPSPANVGTAQTMHRPMYRMSSTSHTTRWRDGRPTLFWDDNPLPAIDPLA